METYLDRILDATRARVAQSRRRRSFEDLDREARDTPPPRPFADAIRAPGMSLIAEFKRRSPSAGEIRAGADPAEMTEAYRQGGAVALSVPTEPGVVSGSLAHLAAAREAAAPPPPRDDLVP